MPEIRFEKLHKRYGSLTVLENLDLSVGHGEFLVLLGPSGCGKTTLLNLLAGLLETTAGRIVIDGRDVTDLDPKDRGLAMVFQSYALYPTKTVRGNLRFGLAALKLDSAEIERRVEWAAKLLQIERLMERKPAQLSGGQRQRVAIGRALVKRAGVLLFDEPLSNLDAKLRTEMRLEIKKLHGELGQTIVYVTHDQIEAMTMATRIAVMDAGVIQQVGTPDDIYETPANLFVARFIGSPAMNVFEAEMEVAGDTVAAVHAPTGCAWTSPATLHRPAHGGDAGRDRAPPRALRGGRGRRHGPRGRLRAAGALQRAGRGRRHRLPRRRRPARRGAHRSRADAGAPIGVAGAGELSRGQAQRLRRRTGRRL